MNITLLLEEVTQVTLLSSLSTLSFTKRKFSEKQTDNPDQDDMMSHSFIVVPTHGLVTQFGD